MGFGQAHVLAGQVVTGKLAINPVLRPDGSQEMLETMTGFSGMFIAALSCDVVTKIRPERLGASQTKLSRNS